MNLGEIYKYIKDKLGANEAAILIKHFTKAGRAEIITRPQTPVSDEACGRLLNAVSRRENFEPLQYIIGCWEFYGMSFLVGEGVLIPRQDTETLCDEAISLLPESGALLDLCSGSGCIPAAIKANRPDADVYALEKFPQAFRYLTENIMQNNVEVTAVLSDALCPSGDVLNSLPKLDMIVSNPPYLTEGDMASLQKEVQSEPRTALYGGEDGLLFYRRLTEVWREKLKRGGILMYEIGAGQEQSVSEILAENGFENVCHKRDLCGIIRVVYGTKK